ncbi:hypothetical protein GCM10009613_16120 [Pseudonocardia kongjuensis]|uniref:Ligand-binding protein with streptavidin-like fold n=1 Tax=Pseudonocardia kongjuensis TaxID=102227 RepID=A0ABP4I9L8_9PSEU
MSSTAPSLRFTGATVYPTPSHAVPGELAIRDGVITHAGPAAPGDDGHGRVIDARGTSIVPLLDGNALRARPAGERGAYDLVPGNPATFAVVRGRVGESQMRNMLVVRPADLLAVVVDGEILVRDGEPTPAAGAPDPDAWVGVWTDRGRALDQHLLPGGRYTETRGGRVDAYTGAWWTRGDRIVYRDDSGFWAFGVRYDGVIYHAGIVLRR